MGIYNKYPYSDFHELNLDFVLSKLHELDAKVNGDLEDLLKEQIDRLFIDAVYNPVTENISLTLASR